MSGKPFSVGIVGATGYTGAELVRLLCSHPSVEVTVITSRGELGKPVADLYPSLRGFTELCFVEPSVEVLASCDVVFFATPHNVSMKMMPELMQEGIRVVDLSADFRLRDVAVWERWYNETHACPEYIESAVYGLPEIFSEEIKQAQLVAGAGCFPTSVQLGFWPLLQQGLVKQEGLIANAATGVSGAGRQAKIPMLFAEANDSYKSYAASGHRHLPEIEQGLTLAAGQATQVTFVPHLVPMIRGIQATLYAQLQDSGISNEALQKAYEDFYRDAPFVDVLPFGSLPETRSVKGSNMCRIALHRPQGRDTIVVLSVIDNLVKGASGQAIQCMNLMLGLPETTGLMLPALMP